MSALRLSALIAAILCVPSNAEGDSGSNRAPFDGPMRGMTVSCPRYGQIWGSPRFSGTLDELDGLGVRWVSIHPYAGINRSGRVRWSPAEETGYLPGAVRRAKGRTHLFWKPHLAYWGSFKWRGEIDFSDGSSRERFAQTYRAFILDQARFAERHHIPLFAVGTELERLVRYEAYWRELIAEVRKVYSGRITYAANWDGIERVPFWDALDYVGVQAYFPLSVSGDRLPSEAEIQKAWTPHLAMLERVSRRSGRPVVLTEVGYPEAKHAAERPWEPEGYFAGNHKELRRRLMRVALSHLEAQPFVAGMFWWKWIPGRTSGDFAMQAPEARAELKTYWRASP